MTWRTPDGNRWLEDAEAIVVREAVVALVQRIKDNIDRTENEATWRFEIDLFDSLTPTQQLALTKTIAEHLLTETPTLLELNATHEAGVFAIYRTLALELEAEIHSEFAGHDFAGHNFASEFESEPSDSQPGRIAHWRKLALAAYDECYPEDADEEYDTGFDCVWMTPQSVWSTSVLQWEVVAEGLADRILWDRDFEMASEFLDLDPTKAAVVKRAMGISSDYFVGVAPDVKLEEVPRVLRSIGRLTEKSGVG